MLTKNFKIHQLKSHEKIILIFIHQQHQLQFNLKAFQLPVFRKTLPVRMVSLQNLEISLIWNISKWRKQQAIVWLMLKIVQRQNQTGIHLKLLTRKRRNFSFQERIENSQLSWFWVRFEFKSSFFLCDHWCR